MDVTTHPKYGVIKCSYSVSGNLSHNIIHNWQCNSLMACFVTYLLQQDQICLMDSYQMVNIPYCHVDIH